MATTVQDAINLVYWFEKQPDGGTYLKDADIATRLGWFERGAAPPVEAVVDTAQDRRDMKGDAGRVRRARRYVDRNNLEGLFVGYSFGTKTNGAGVKFMMLYTPKMTASDDAVTATTAEQMGRVVQRANQDMAQRVRELGHIEQSRETYFERGDYERAMVCHDAIRDIEIFGRLQPTTREKAARLGILKGMAA